REVTIKNVGVVPATILYQENITNTTEEYEAELAENGMFQLILVDRAHGLSGKPTVFNFSTTLGGLQFNSGAVRILGIEEESSASSSSTSSASSSSSTSSKSS